MANSDQQQDRVTHDGNGGRASKPTMATMWMIMAPLTALSLLIAVPLWSSGHHKTALAFTMFALGWGVVAYASKKLDNQWGSEYAE